jgi:hypothetical protein
MPILWPGERDLPPDEPRPDPADPRVGPALRRELEQGQRIRDNQRRKQERGR